MDPCADDPGNEQGAFSQGGSPRLQDYLSIGGSSKKCRDRSQSQAECFQTQNSHLGMQSSSWVGGSTEPFWAILGRREEFHGAHGDLDGPPEPSLGAVLQLGLLAVLMRHIFSVFWVS